MLPFFQFTLAIAIILTSAKIGGYLSYKLGQPAVVGEVLAGLILGPTVLNFLNWPVFTSSHNISETITFLAELGVLLLLFIAGLELDLGDLIHSGTTAFLTGFLGFIFTFGMGFILATVFAFDQQEAIFIGLMLAPTSIGISAQTLMELKVLKDKVGCTLLGAAAIDDTLGIIGLAFFLAFILGSASSDGINILLILLKMGGYFIIASAIGIWILPRLSRWVEKLPISQGLVSFAFVTMLVYAWSAEVLGNLAAILGAFLAGLFFARSPQKEMIEKGFSTFVYAIFVPIFFVSVGLSANVRQVPMVEILMLVGMVVVVITSKLLGAGVGGRFGDFTGRESFQLGFSMVPRGEVVLILAAIGIAEGLIDGRVFSLIVMLVVVTTLITPPILQRLFTNPAHPDEISNLDYGS